MMSSSRRLAVGIVIVGVVAGLLLSFGLTLLLFEIGESGTNTRSWQAIVGLFAPAVLIVGAAFRVAFRTERLWRLWQLGVATIGGVVVGFAAIFILASWG